MKTRIVQSIFVLLCTVLFASVQDMLPSFGGVKPPLLTAFVLCSAVTLVKRDKLEREENVRSSFSVGWMIVALIAGTFEDALTSFPTGCSTGFMLIIASVARLACRALDTLPGALAGIICTVIAAPFHEIWLSVWGVAGTNPSLLVRFFASAIPAVPVGAIVFLIVPFLACHVAFEGVTNESGRRA